MGNELAFTVSLLYWALLYNNGPVGGVTANTHLVNAIVALADFWICGIPIYTVQMFKEVILYCIFKERRETTIGEDEVMEEREDTF